MKLKEIIQKTHLEEVYCNDKEVKITNGYTGDLLSDVMGNAPDNSVWVTIQSHVNIIAVASIRDIKAIILCNNLEFDKETIAKARENNISLLSSKYNGFQTIFNLFNAGFEISDR
ncbi:MAG: iron-sulfur binding hydrogenase [Thermotogota bacterium]|nr:iron-sulfur binding hydrogenase [Thermotogota bacterium]